MARDTRVSIRVNQNINNELEEVALDCGLTKSSLGAYIIGQWLKTNRQITFRIKNQREEEAPLPGNCR